MTMQPIEDLKQSRTGKRPVDLPKGVTVTLKDGTFEVKGPKGTITKPLPPNVKVTIEGTKLIVMPTIGGRDGSRFQGLAQSLIKAAVIGVTTGYTISLVLVGTGYRAEVKGPVLNLSLGFSHPIAFPLPKGLTITIPGESKGTILILSCADKETIGQAAAKIRAFRPPEPYGGKGVRYQDEKVREKAGKAAKGAK